MHGPGQFLRKQCAAVQVELNEDGSEVELGKGAFGVVVKGTYRYATAFFVGWTAHLLHVLPISLRP